MKSFIFLSDAIFLAEDTLVAISQARLIELTKSNFGMNSGQLPHVMQELGWQMDKVKWGGKDHARAIWVKRGYSVSRGRVSGPDGYDCEVDRQPGSTRFEIVEAA